MSTTEIIGWIVWALFFLGFTVGWTLGCVTYVKRGLGVTYPTLNTTVIWWLLVGWTFYYPSMSKLHLLWLAPLASFLSTFITHATVLEYGVSGLRKDPLPPGIVLLLVIHLVLLWMLTPEAIL